METLGRLAAVRVELARSTRIGAIPLCTACGRSIAIGAFRFGFGFSSFSDRAVQG